MTTTTIVDTGTPPTLPTPWTAPTLDYREALTPHRSLPDTGSHDLLLPSAGLLLSVGLLLTVWARRARQKRTQQYYAEPINSDHWSVMDRHSSNGRKIIVTYDNRDAAKHYAQALNAGAIRPNGGQSMRDRLADIESRPPLSERNQP